MLEDAYRSLINPTPPPPPSSLSKKCCSSVHEKCVIFLETNGYKDTRKVWYTRAEMKLTVEQNIFQDKRI